MLIDFKDTLAHLFATEVMPAARDFMAEETDPAPPFMGLTV